MNAIMIFPLIEKELGTTNLLSYLVRNMSKVRNFVVKLLLIIFHFELNE
jgi:hypothetical protein